jgi:hypothetical protein
MIFIKEYNGVVFENLESIFKKTNIDFYNYISGLGIDLDLSKKDQQKIYLHHFIIYLCNVLKAHNDKIIFYINTFSICDIQKKIIKKIKRMFGIRIWESPYTLDIFLDKLKNRDVVVTDCFELYLNTKSKPKSFRHIKKYLDKEGFTSLSDSYFQDIANKMAILC